ncbi:recombination protein NinB [Agrobacterium sp. MCAB5]|uniref:recombination protein NinB n=1 Tax=Agrobacterium sp. MCAB5 TaxID=3233042 RepID=UPI003F8E668A
MSTREAVVINTPADREKVVRWARGVSDGTIVEFRKSTRSHEQNAKMHAMLGEVSDQVVWYGQKLKVEDWKNMFTASLRKASVVPGIDPGTVVPLGIHTSSMTIDEMSNMIELIYAFGSQNDVTFKDPKQDNTPSDDTPSTASSSADAGNTPVDEAGADDSPASDAPASTIFPIDRADLIECCRKLMFIVVDPSLETPPQRRDTLIAAKDMWKGQLPEELHPHIAGFFESAYAQIKADPKVMPTLRENALTLYAEVLDCKVSDLGGVDD